MANTTTTPTFTPDGLTAHPITKSGGAALIPGAIVANQEVEVRYNLANTRWEMVTSPGSGTGAGQLVELDATDKLPAVDGSNLTNLPIFGGATLTSPMSSNIVLTNTSKRVQTFAPNAFGLAIQLPDATTLAAIGAYPFVFINIGSYPVQIIDSTAALIGYVTPGQRMPLVFESAIAPVTVGGTSSGSNSATTLNDTTKSFQTNLYAGGTLVITAGTGNGQTRTIASNTATQVTVTVAFGVTPDNTSVYTLTPTGPTAAQGLWRLSSGDLSKDNGLSWWGAPVSITGSNPDVAYHTTLALSAQFGLNTYFDGTNYVASGVDRNDASVKVSNSPQTMVSTSNIDSPITNNTIDCCALSATRGFYVYSAASVTKVVVVDLDPSTLAVTVNTAASVVAAASTAVSCDMISSTSALITWCTSAVFHCAVVTISGSTCTVNSSGTIVSATIGRARTVVLSATLAHVLYTGAKIVRVVLSGSSAPVPGTPFSLTGRALLDATGFVKATSAVSYAVLVDNSNRLFGNVFTDTGSGIAVTETQLAFGSTAAGNIYVPLVSFACSNGSIAVVVGTHTADMPAPGFMVTHISGTTALVGPMLPCPPLITSAPQLLQGYTIKSNSGIGVFPGGVIYAATDYYFWQSFCLA